jgi:hypothetical protein
VFSDDAPASRSSASNRLTPRLAAAGLLAWSSLSCQRDERGDEEDDTKRDRPERDRTSDHANRDPESAERPASEKPNTEPSPPNLSADANERPRVQGHKRNPRGWLGQRALTRRGSKMIYRGQGMRQTRRRAGRRGGQSVRLRGYLTEAIRPGAPLHRTTSTEPENPPPSLT